jgi:hypothetical protein
LAWIAARSFNVGKQPVDLVRDRRQVCLTLDQSAFVIELDHQPRPASE